MRAGTLGTVTWLYALAFVAVMLAVAWVADRRAARARPFLAPPRAITAGPRHRAGGPLSG